MPCNSPRWHATKRASKAAREESLRYVKKEYTIPFVPDEWRRNRHVSVCAIAQKKSGNKENLYPHLTNNNGVSGNGLKISLEVPTPSVV